MTTTDNQALAASQAEKFYAAMRAQPPIRFPQRPEDVAAAAVARAFRFGSGEALAARVFGASDAPIVALMHGWGGQATQFFRMALALADGGFQAVVVDCGNHGEAAATPLGFDRFMIDAQMLADHLGTMPFAWIAHSAAALAIMSARRTHNLSAQAFVSIAAPFTPYVPLNRFRAMGASDDAIAAVKPMLAAEFGCAWDALEDGLAWQRDPAGQLLAIYDADDTMVDIGDADRIETVWPDSRILRTSGFGHNKVLGAPPVIDASVAFLKKVKRSRWATEQSA